MTDRIDLDELAEETGASTERPASDDWLWREEGPPDEGATGDVDGAPEEEDRGPGGGDDAPSREDRSQDPVPHVPRPNKDKPVGIPVEGGGAEGGAGRGSGSAGPARGATGSTDGASPEGTSTDGEAASGPHGSGADDMTLALTYEAATRLADPAAAFADTARWADWVGIVGDVEAHVINKFQREHNVDVDFFNGSGTDPGERLAGIDGHSMFFAERMVVVGVEGRDERVARAADWEFVPLATAAEKAGWDLAE